jgi:hypothetical protein
VGNVSSRFGFQTFGVIRRIPTKVLTSALQGKAAQLSFFFAIFF